MDHPETCVLLIEYVLLGFQGVRPTPQYLIAGSSYTNENIVMLMVRNSNFFSTFKLRFIRPFSISACSCERVYIAADSVSIRVNNLIFVVSGAVEGYFGKAKGHGEIKGPLFSFQ